MIPEKSISLCGKWVTLRYCAATETGFETLSGKSSDIFIPDVQRDSEGNVESITQRATTEDYLRLAFSAIIAAYARKDEEAPITADDILYDATPQEITELITAVLELRAKWYQVPDVVKPEVDVAGEGEDEPKNVQAPTTSSKK